MGHGFDLPRLLDNLHKLDSRRTAVHHKAIEAVESYTLVLDQMYRAVYYHHTVRAASFLLSAVLRRAAALYKGGDKTMLPLCGSGRQNPLQALLDLGQKISLEDYLRLSEHQIWSLIEDWQFSSDKVLADLAGRLLRRSLFKAVDVDNTKMTETNELKDYAEKIIFEKMAIPKNDAGFYVGWDNPSRLSYRRYDWLSEEKESDHLAVDESIWIIKSASKAVALEQMDERGLVSGMKKVSFFPRLIFPEEIRAEIDAFKKEKKL